MCLSPTSKYFSTTPFCHRQSGEVSAGLVLLHWLCVPPTFCKQSPLSLVLTWASTWCPPKYGNIEVIVGGR